MQGRQQKKKRKIMFIKDIEQELQPTTAVRLSKNLDILLKTIWGLLGQCLGSFVSLLHEIHPRNKPRLDLPLSGIARRIDRS